MSRLPVASPGTRLVGPGSRGVRYANLAMGDIMSERHTTIRSLHDLGAALWLGGSLMGAVGLNGASKTIADPTERAQVASAGWARWAPVSAAAIGAHLIGGAALLYVNRGRVRGQSGVTANTVVKTVLTVAALATTAYSGVLGAKIAKAGAVPSEGATDSSAATPDEVATAQRQQRVLQWATPALTAGLVALGAQQGEQQRASQMAQRLGPRLGNLVATGR